MKRDGTHRNDDANGEDDNGSGDNGSNGKDGGDDDERRRQRRRRDGERIKIKDPFSNEFVIHRDSCSIQKRPRFLLGASYRQQAHPRVCNQRLLDYSRHELRLAQCYETWRMRDKRVLEKCPGLCEWTRQIAIRCLVRSVALWCFHPRLTSQRAH